MASDDRSNLPPGNRTRLGYMKPPAAKGSESIDEAETMAMVPAPAPAGSPVSSAGTVLVKTTVLPRIRIVGDETHLVTEAQERYEEGQALGSGGFGEVVAARDQDIDREVAIKRLHPEMHSPEVITRFVEEIRTVGRLEHPGIVPIHDVGVDDVGRYFFVMKNLSGETLEDIIEGLATGKPGYAQRFGFEKRVQIFLGILEAMHYAHAQGIIHRDIKPANVMVGRYGEVVVLDWGIAKRQGHADPVRRAPDGPEGSPLPSAGVAGSERPATMDGTLLGTPAYMSPEQARGDNEAIDARSDIYSLSALFYELLTLRHYLEGRSGIDAILEGVQHQIPVNPTRVSNPLQSPVPADLGWFVLKGLEKDPQDRYQSVEEMIMRLARRADGYIPVQCPLTLTKAATNGWLHFVDRHPTLYMGGMVTAVLAVVGLCVFLLVR